MYIVKGLPNAMLCLIMRQCYEDLSVVIFQTFFFLNISEVSSMTVPFKISVVIIGVIKEKQW